MTESWKSGRWKSKVKTPITKQNEGRHPEGGLFLSLKGGKKWEKENS